MSSAEISFRSSGAASDFVPAQAAGRRGAGWLAAYLCLMLLGALAVIGAVAAAVDTWSPTAWTALGLVAIAALWISGGAATAILGLLVSVPAPLAVPASWRPARGTAILLLLCGEPPAPIADYLRTLRRGADALGLDEAATIFVLSDTRGAERIAAEEAALAPLVAGGAIVYRRRAINIDRKPGNIAEWLDACGDAFGYMAVLDADSRMTAGRIHALIHRMEHEPTLGLLQAGMGMVPGRSLFGRHQRLASRLLSPNFCRGLAAWSADAGNYWGHNAIMRVAAFRNAAALPVLSGPAPFGGPPLSHDFVEAAWIRRAGWRVVLDPDMHGSAEDGPQTLDEFYRRDRRWCQGNLQHLRVIGEPGLDPVSRLHLASGIVGYLVAPVWLALMVLVAADLVSIDGALPLLNVAAILLLPKVVAFADRARRVRTTARRKVVLRASLRELALSTLIAPLVMLRQSGAVLSVLMGRDCGWKSGRDSRFRRLPWLPEVAVGAGLLTLGASTGSAMAALWLLPVALPLLAAPVLQRWLDRGA
jgi:membrane glycosyltransferase